MRGLEAVSLETVVGTEVRVVTVGEVVEEAVPVCPTHTSIQRVVERSREFEVGTC